MAAGIHLPSSAAKVLTRRPSMVNYNILAKKNSGMSRYPVNSWIGNRWSLNNKPLSLVLRPATDEDDLARSVGPDLYKFHVPDEESPFEVYVRLQAEMYQARLRKNQINRMELRRSLYVFGLKWKKWEDTHTLPQRLAVYTAWNFFKNFLFGVSLSFLLLLEPSNGPKLLSVSQRDYHPIVYSFTRSKLMFALHFAVFWGSYAFIAYLMKYLRGGKEEDLVSSMVGGLGSGVIISLVTGLRVPCVIRVAVITAVFCGLRFKLRKPKKKRKWEK